MSNFLRNTLLFLSAMLLTTAALANASDAKIGFVDRERIVRESAPAKRSQAKLEKEFSTRKTELDKLQKQGRDMQVVLQKESVTLPEADRTSVYFQLNTYSAHLLNLF